MSELKLSKDLSLPIDAVTQTFAFLGRRGSGKTYGAGKLAELFLDAGAQIVVLDGIGVWYGLRLKADGQGKGFSIPVFGGEQGDVPLEPQAGRLIAKLIVDEQFSAILDVSSFRKQERKTFVTDFAEELFHRKKNNRSAIHFFCEESQMFIPERGGKESARMVGAFEDLIKLGRNYGIGVSLISQRPQAVNKEVLNQTEILLAFQMTGPHERDALHRWISDKGIDEDLRATLPSLKVGDARLWSPQFLGLSQTIHIAKKKTYDASSTPTVGAAIVQPKELSPVDVEKIKESMADVVKRADESDPKKLKAEILKLRREVEQAQKAIPQAVAAVATKEVIKEVPVIPTDEIKALASEISAFRKDYIGKLDVIAKGISNLNGHVILERIETQIGKLVLTVPAIPAQKVSPVARPLRKITFPNVVYDRQPVAEGDFRPNKKQQEILDALAWYESLGNFAPSPTQIGAVALIDPTGGYFSNMVGPLVTYGLVERGSGVLRLTDEGRTLAQPMETAYSLDAYHDVLRARVRKMKTAGGKSIAMIDALVAAGGNPMTTEELGNAVGIDHTGGYFSNMIGPLVTAGLVTRGGGVVTPTEVLFPEGLL